VSHSSNTSNAVCPPPEVTFNSEDADKRIMLKRTGKRFGRALYCFVLTPRQDMRPQKRASGTVPLEQPKLTLSSSQVFESCRAKSGVSENRTVKFLYSILHV